VRVQEAVLRRLPASGRTLPGTVLRLRDLLLVVLTLVALLVPATGSDRLILAAVLALLVLPYNEALRVATDRRGDVPPVMGVADQLLCAGIVLVWPEVAAPVFIAGMLDVAVAAALLPRRAAMAAALTGAVLVTVPLLVLGALGQVTLPPGYLFAAPAYGVSAVVTALAIGTVAGRERDVRSQLSGILDALPVVVYEMDATTWQVRYVSPAITALTGQDPADLLGDPTALLSTVHRRDVGSLLSLISDVSTSRQTRELEYRVFHASGRQRWVRNSATVELDLKGRAVTVRGSLADITAQKDAEAALATQARTDPLTRLPNRLALLDALACAGPGQLVFLDVDGFKRINDSLGHGAGDTLLVEVARRLTAAVGGQDVVARLGGDEFVVLAAGPAVDLPSRLLGALDPPFSLVGRTVRVTASAGAVAVGVEPVVRPEELLERADAAMYVAKRRGPGRAAWYDPAMRETAQDRLDLESELREALVRQEFRVLYQPLVRALDHVVVGYEALVRWEHPVRGTVAPDAFIGVAEDTGLIVGIGRHVLREACRQQARWAAAGCPSIAVSVNLSARQLRDPELVDVVRAALVDAGVPGSALVLEITETALVDEPDRVLVALEALRALGVRIALDDFGTGFSSLSHLHRFPVDTVKVDRSFVAGVLDPSSRDRAIVTAVLHLAAHMGLRVVAEGVEQREQAEVLRELGCDLLQGWAFGRPAPPVVRPLPLQRAAPARPVPLSR
jgi:diguanylate cyclase (GGDEF)-like protein/PAS domain S-box-containing protein